MRESVKILEQLIDNIPEGDFQAKTKAVLKLPKGEFYQRVETARGEFGVYIVSEGATTPYRIKFQVARFCQSFRIESYGQRRQAGRFGSHNGNVGFGDTGYRSDEAVSDELRARSI